MIESKEGVTIDYKFFVDSVDEKYVKLNSINKEESIENFIEGEEISGDIFFSLCEDYNVIIPNKTKSWIRRFLLSIKILNNNCVCDYKGSYKSASIDKVAQELYKNIQSEV